MESAKKHDPQAYVMTLGPVQGISSTDLCEGAAAGTFIATQHLGETTATTFSAKGVATVTRLPFAGIEVTMTLTMTSEQNDNLDAWRKLYRDGDMPARTFLMRDFQGKTKYSARQCVLKTPASDSVDSTTDGTRDWVITLLQDDATQGSSNNL